MQSEGLKGQTVIPGKQGEIGLKGQQGQKGQEGQGPNVTGKNKPII